MLSMAFSSPKPSSLYRDPFRSLPAAPRQPNKLFSFFNSTQNINYSFHHLSCRFSPTHNRLMKKKRGSGAVCYSAPFTTRDLQWVCTVSSAVLMLARGTAIQKSFLVPLFALQAPSSIVSWIKGEYGTWTAFLALLVRLFFFIPGELELPLAAFLLVIVAPYQAMNLRGTQAGAIVSLVIAGYLVFQHFSRAGSLQSAFERGSIIATVALICTTAVTCVLLI